MKRARGIEEAAIGLTIWTVGSSNRQIGEFTALLKGYRIALVADVRRFPTSHFEHFRQPALEEALREAGISYLWLGETLGGYRRGGYQAYMEGTAFKNGLKRLMEIGRRKRTAILCSERLPWRCHRRFIGQALAVLGWKVVHVIEENRTWSPGQAPSGNKTPSLSI